MQNDSDSLVRYADLVRFNSSEPPKIGELVSRKNAPDLPIGMLVVIHGEWATIAVTRIQNPINLGQGDNES